MANSKPLHANYWNNKTLTLDANGANGQRVTVERIKVSGKREARKVAEERGAVCWNF